MLFARSRPGYEPASLPGGGKAADSFSCSVAGRAWSRRGFQATLWRSVRLLLRIDKSLNSEPSDRDFTAGNLWVVRPGPNSK